jgi:hypothetical protein
MNNATLVHVCRRFIAMCLRGADLRPLASSIHWKGWA